MSPFAPIERLTEALEAAGDSKKLMVGALRNHYPRGDTFDGLALASLADPGGLSIALAGL